MDKKSTGASRRTGCCLWARLFSQERIPSIALSQKPEEIEMADFKKAAAGEKFATLYTGLHFLNPEITPPKPSSPPGKTSLLR